MMSGADPGDSRKCQKFRKSTPTKSKKKILTQYLKKLKRKPIKKHIAEHRFFFQNFSGTPKLEKMTHKNELNFWNQPHSSSSSRKSRKSRNSRKSNVVQPMPRGRGALYWLRRCQGKGHKGRKVEHRFIQRRSSNHSEPRPERPKLGITENLY